MLSQPVRVDKKWGWETQIVNNRMNASGVGYCGKILSVLPNGQCCSIHYHKGKVETFYVLRGRLILEVFRVPRDVPDPQLSDILDTEVHKLHRGVTITLPTRTPHRFWTEDLEMAEFIEFSTPDDPADSYRLIESCQVDDKDWWREKVD